MTREPNPSIISADDHMLFSRYSNSKVSPGIRKFGETRFILYSIDNDGYETSSAVTLKKFNETFGPYQLFDVRWNFSNGPFELRVSDFEWRFEQPEEIYFVSQYQFDDDLFEISDELLII